MGNLKEIPSPYTLDCTGDCVVGDEVEFQRATFTGSWKKPKFNGYETIRAQIIKDSYGEMKQQHTFTLMAEDGRKILIKGRNLYRKGIMRKPWSDESQRERVRAEKHERGEQAREARYVRKYSYDGD